MSESSSILCWCVLEVLELGDVTSEPDVPWFIELDPEPDPLVMLDVPAPAPVPVPVPVPDIDCEKAGAAAMSAMVSVAASFFIRSSVIIP